MRALLLRNLSIGLVLSASAGLWSGEAPGRSISVNGQAEVKVVPDEVVLTLGVETRAKEIPALRNEHDRRVKAVLAAAREFHIPEKDLKTDYLQLEPQMGSGSVGSGPMVVGYVERTTLVVTLRDVGQFESLLASVLSAGATHVHGINFRTRELRKHRDEARAMAIKAAKEKAAALAGALGQKVGRPLTIQEGSSGWWSSYGGWGNRINSMPQNVAKADDGPSDASDASIAPGTIGVTASVQVSFELE